MNYEVTIEEMGLSGLLTTEHAASSYGLPVLVIDEEGYGPEDRYGDDVPGRYPLHPTEPMEAKDIERAEAAGWMIGDEG